MNLIFTPFVLSFTTNYSLSSYAQIIGIENNRPDLSVKLDIENSNKELLILCSGNAQRNCIGLAAPICNNSEVNISVTGNLF
jgi:hypothetical protein